MVQELLSGETVPVWVDRLALVVMASLLLLLGAVERRRSREEAMREATRCRHRGCERWLSLRAMTKAPTGEQEWAYWCPQHGASRLTPIDAARAEADGASQSAPGS